jgi:hypothetical protein
MKKYGEELNSRDSWDQMAQVYSDRLSNDYHNHRLAVINALIPEELYWSPKTRPHAKIPKTSHVGGRR